MSKIYKVLQIQSATPGFIVHEMTFHRGKNQKLGEPCEKITSTWYPVIAFALCNVSVLGRGEDETFETQEIMPLGNNWGEGGLSVPFQMNMFGSVEEWEDEHSVTYFVCHVSQYEFTEEFRSLLGNDMTKFYAYREFFEGK